MIWVAVPALSMVGALVLYLDFRGRSRTPLVDAILGGCGIFACLALWGWGPPLLFS